MTGKGKTALHYFTLVELLIVVAIIMLLLSILQAGLISMRDNSYETICRQNLCSLTVGTTSYCFDNIGYYPKRYNGWLLNGWGNPEYKANRLSPNVVQYGTGLDLRIQLKPYFGKTCGSEFVCPYNTVEDLGNADTGIESIPQVQSYSMSYNLYPNATYTYRNVVNDEDADNYFAKIAFAGKHVKKNGNVKLQPNGDPFLSDLMWSDRLVIRNYWSWINVVYKNSGSTAYEHPASKTNKRYGSSHIPSSLSIHEKTGKNELVARGYISSNWSYKDGSVLEYEIAVPFSIGNASEPEVKSADVMANWGPATMNDWNNTYRLAIFPNAR